MTAALKRLGLRRGDPPPDTPRDMLLVLRPDAAASPEMMAAACAANYTVAVVLPLKIHGYSLGLPNPGLMPTARERAAAEKAITSTVNRLRRAGVDADGQIVVTRHAHRAIPRIVRRRGATRVLVESSGAGRLRRFLEGDLCSQLSRRLRPEVVVESVLQA
jgi:nucleotide-binding universal stress UspA family protein